MDLILFNEFNNFSKNVINKNYTTLLELDRFIS